MPSAADNAFARRMMERPISACLNSDQNYRDFYDPPELIQRAFGGREWFFETGCSRVHRVGLFKGVGWEIDPMFSKQDERGITGVRITSRRPRASTGTALYDMEFLHRWETDPSSASAPCAERVIDHRPGLELHQLKPAYAEVLGEYVT